MAKHFTYMREMDPSDPIHVVHVLGWRVGRFWGRLQWGRLPKDYRHV